MCSVLPGEPVRGTGFCAPSVVSISDKANSFPGYSDAKYRNVLWTERRSQQVRAHLPSQPNQSHTSAMALTVFPIVSNQVLGQGFSNA